MRNPFRRRHRDLSSYVSGSWVPDAPVLSIEYRTLSDRLSKRFRRSGRRDAKRCQNYPGQLDVHGYVRGLGAPLRGWFERQTAGLTAQINAAVAARPLELESPTAAGGPDNRGKRQAVTARQATIDQGYTAADRLLSTYLILRGEVLSIASLHQQAMSAYCQGHGSAPEQPFVLPEWFTRVRHDIRVALEALDIEVQDASFTEGEVQYVH